MRKLLKQLVLAGSIGAAHALAATPAPSVEAAFVEEQAVHLDRLIEHLDADNPDIRQIRDAWRTGDKVGAASRLAGFFSNRQLPPGVLREIHIAGNPVERADAAIEGRFFLLDRWHVVSRREDDGLDWRDRGPGGDKELAWMLNRHAVFVDLAEAYRETGSVHYRDSLNALWQDWILTNPYPDRLTFSPPWRALEVARRVLNAWLHVLFQSDAVDPETRLLAIASLLDHADALHEHASIWGGNHLITEKLALLTLVTAFPEFRGSGDWGDQAAKAVSEQFLAQTYPDGSYKELSNHYQKVVLRNAWQFLQLRRHSDPGLMDRPVTQTIERMIDFFARVTRPDGTGPLNNASDLEMNAAFLKEVWPFFDRPDWLFIATNGSEGRRPAQSPSTLFMWAGQALLRSGWDAAAHWVYFDAGPYGTAHQHVDRLHLSASVSGRPFLVDTGRFTYQPGPWRDYFKGPESHNLIMLDGKAAVRPPRSVDAPLRIAFHESPDLAYAGSATVFRPDPDRFPGTSLKGSVPWTRSVLLDKAGLVLVIDHLVTFDRHEVTTRWHFHPDREATEINDAFERVAPAGVLERTVSTGHYSAEYNRKVPCPMLEYSGTIKRPTTLLWLLRDPRTPRPDIEVLTPPGAPVMEIRIQHSGHPSRTHRLRVHPFPEYLETRDGSEKAS